MERKRLLALIGVIFIIAFTAGWLVKGSEPAKEQPDLIIDTGEKTQPGVEETVKPVQPPATMYIYVVGAVKKPGIYQLPMGSRVFQAVELAEAGARADESQLDMARVLVDGEKIRVPKQGEKLTVEQAVGASPSSPNGSGGLVNINTASVQELDSRLPGVGPSYAQRIVDYRSQHPFTKKEDIKEVSGIGDKRYEAIKDLITVGP